MTTIKTVDALEELYGAAVPRALTKVVDHVTPLYRDWIEAARFCVLSTVGPEGTDASPRGDVDPVVRIAGAKELWLPDWRGNNRLDSLRNIVRDGRVSLMFMVPGSANVVRVNGRAVLSVASDILDRFEQGGKHPRSVIVVQVEEIYFQCAKAIMRSQLWTSEPNKGLPTAGELVREQEAGFDAEGYDAGYAEYAKSRMW